MFGSDDRSKWLPDPQSPNELRVSTVSLMLRDPSVEDGKGNALVPSADSLQFNSVPWFEDGCPDEEPEGWIGDSYIEPHLNTVCPDCIESWNGDYYLRVTYTFVVSDVPTD